MPDPLDPARPLTVLRARGLKGRFDVPPEPGLFCLAAMLGACARGETVIYTAAAEPDPNLVATLGLLSELSVRVEISDDRWHIGGLGALGLLAPEKPVDFSDAGRALPLAMGLAAPYEFSTRLTGLSGPAVPPALIAGLRAMGAEVRERHGGYLPISVRGPRTPVPLAGRLPAGSLDAKAALMLCALALPGVSSLTEAPPAADHAERLFRLFGAEVRERPLPDGNRALDVAGLPALGARTLTIGGDPDLAALAVLAALVVPESDVLVENVLLHPARITVLSRLRDMGGHIAVSDRRYAAGEETADLHVRHSALLGIDVPAGGLTPADAIVLAVAGCFAAGETRLPRLGTAGEADQHRMLTEDLSRNGALVRSEAGGLVISRPAAGRRLGGGLVAGSSPFHAAALMVLGLAGAEQVTIADEAAMETAYPGLIRSFEALGAEFYRGWAA